MKILYVGSNPLDATSLNFDREITELQRQVSNSSAEPVSIRFMPGLPVEDLSSVLHRERPDILHVAAHAEGERLHLANQTGDRIEVNAEALSKFIHDQHPPSLVYINACDSDEIAKGLIGKVAMAIGSTAPITNRAARAAAVSFYERLLAGSSVQRAFEVGQKVMEASAAGQASTRLHLRTGLDANKIVLHSVPRLIAEFKDGMVRSDKNGNYSIRLGLVGCPPFTRQVIFFTDDDSFAINPNSLESDMCHVVRGVPAGGVIMVDAEESWSIAGDFRLFATGVGNTGDQYSVSAMLSEALETRYRIAFQDLPASIVQAIADLRNRGGYQLDSPPLIG